MPGHESGGATSFKELERQGWGAKAGNYDALGGQITIGAVGPLLDAAGVRTGMRVLDVAAGPGYVAAGADARRARNRNRFCGGYGLGGAAPLSEHRISRGR